jgi:hypothetical protein
MAGARRLLLAALTALACLPGPSARGGEPLPYRLAVAVEFGVPPGPQSLRDELLYVLVAELRAAGCFLEAGAEGEHDLLLEVRLEDFREDVEAETSIAERAASTDPYVERRRVVHSGSTFEVRVLTPEQGVVRSKRFRLQNSWRPIFDEDPREKARRELVERAVERVRKFTCKGSQKKWSQEVQGARDSAASR